MNTNFANLDKTAMSSTSRLDEIFASQFFIASRHQSSNLLHRAALDPSPSTDPRINHLHLGNKGITSAQDKLKNSYIPHRLPRIFFIHNSYRFLFLLQRTLHGKDEFISEERVECSEIMEGT